MKIAKRVVLFVAVNILVMVTISIVMSLLGVQPYLQANGINYESLAVFCLIWGFGGAFISLSLSRVMAKFGMGVQVIDPMQAHGESQWLVETVHRLSHQAGLPAMPEVGIYNSPEVNAFATGPTKSRALVAVSSGLLQNMNRQEAEGVLAHEVAHIANGDMVTMTLIQGVVNAFVMFFARVIAFALSQFVKEEGPRHLVRMVATIALEIGLSFLGMIIVAYFSRQREFRADAGGAQLGGRENMINALKSLQRVYEPSLAAAAHAGTDKPSFDTLKISSKSKGLLAFFMTHPPLEVRIKRLQGIA